MPPHAPPRWAAPHPLRYIGTGVGRLLLAEGEEWLTARGRDTAILWVFSDNLPVRAFYEGSGWTYAGHEQVDAGLQKAGFPVRERLCFKVLDEPLRETAV